MRIFDQTFSTEGAEMVKPDIEMLPYLNQMPGTAKEQALVYFPIYLITYAFEGKTWSAVISATSGEVFTSEYPTRSSTRISDGGGGRIHSVPGRGAAGDGQPRAGSGIDGIDRDRTFRRLIHGGQEDVRTWEFKSVSIVPPAAAHIQMAEGENVVNCKYCNSTLFIEGDFRCHHHRLQEQDLEDSGGSRQGQLVPQWLEGRDLPARPSCSRSTPSTCRSGTRTSGSWAGYADMRSEPTATGRPYPHRAHTEGGEMVLHEYRTSSRDRLRPGRPGHQAPAQLRRRIGVRGLRDDPHLRGDHQARTMRWTT